MRTFECTVFLLLLYCQPVRWVRPTDTRFRKGNGVFTAQQFLELEQFWFRQAHFYSILACLKDEHGRAMMSGGE
eukprot:3435762-Rhodomonas_salina.1